MKDLEEMSQEEIEQLFKGSDQASREAQEICERDRQALREHAAALPASVSTKGDCVRRHLEAQPSPELSEEFVLGT